MISWFVARETHATRVAKRATRREMESGCGRDSGAMIHRKTVIESKVFSRA